MTHSVLMALLGLAAGACLSAVYFGGLWLTTRRIRRTGRLATLVMASYMGRLAFCLVGFYLVATLAGLLPLVTSVGAFMVTQVVLVRGLSKRAVLSRHQGDSPST